MTSEIKTTIDGENVVLYQNLSNIVISIMQIDELIEQLEEAQHDIRMWRLEESKRKRRERQQ